MKRDAAFFQFAKVKGNAWNDANRNGMREPDELSTPGVEVTLLDEMQQTVTTAITSPSGDYVVDGLIPGTTAVHRTSR